MLCIVVILRVVTRQPRPRRCCSVLTSFQRLARTESKYRSYHCKLNRATHDTIAANLFFVAATKGLQTLLSPLFLNFVKGCSFHESHFKVYLRLWLRFHSHVVQNLFCFITSCWIIACRVHANTLRICIDF